MRARCANDRQRRYATVEITKRTADQLRIRSAQKVTAPEPPSLRSTFEKFGVVGVNVTGSELSRKNESAYSST